MQQRTCLVALLVVALSLQASLAEWSYQTSWFEKAREDKVARGTVWPKPLSATTGTGTPARFSLDPGKFKLVADSSSAAGTDKECKEIVDHALSRYADLLFWIPEDERVSVSGDETVDQLVVTVTSPCSRYPSRDMDESYAISVGYDGATLRAPTAWGALRGLETFSQLLYEDNGKHVIDRVTISDSPRFTHRGIMVDTARHFIPLPYILQNLDAMAYNKMNVFHWHMVDDQSFPFQSTTFPDLSGKGAYTRKHVYTHDDVSKVIEFARLRGIRVIPEFDSPGHMMSWGQGHPDLLTRCSPTDFQPDIYYLGPANPAREETYTFMQSLFQEIREVFADECFHVGGDEVRFQCWMSNEEVQQFMRQEGFPNTTEGFANLQGHYIKRILDILHQIPQRTRGIVWQEVFDTASIANDLTDLSLDTIVHVWEWNDTRFQGEPFKEELAKVTRAGYNAILSSCYYLNYISYGRDWPQYYDCDPQDFQGTRQQKDLVLGGEACLWGEWVDSTNFVPRMWPRASAVAERLWSPQSVTDSAAASPRMEEHRCRMVRRGIPAQPQGPSYCKYEWNIQGDLPNYRPVITSSGPRVAAAGLLHSVVLSVLVLAAAKLWA
ncbi:PREDICTED: beta-hexosaminidase subunit beta-like [Branchiostoma belcheri]|uniref:Beta-hexosaminidase n=1 Tax=Branchiostoma belcheri TaxID=7741 RepID=A0A6P4YGG6_BRABE|nr:PREDICTED: beta-hexosaminidase subunit beta-like [Branchiostoma belcheri]